ncbi:hypothetical protein [Micromonospora sp. HK10]|uniref:hypothetical protein n=1 Tax=Micromonospora sp. HK10 TaxID=1538294 RepID=UPI0006270CFB|nr:hypothetical protein [Micromonospora sp. HK10]KKK06832.1 hypothetical protein LQ51_06000 [Micromonospora sp. HK10]
MPASRRHHRALAVIVNCLGVLAALPTLAPATPGAAATPSAAATATPGATAATAAPGAAAATATPGAAPATAAPGAAAATPTPGAAVASAQPVAGPGQPAAAPAPAERATPIPTGMPAAPPAVAPTRPAPIQLSKPPVTVAVTPAGTATPRYQIQVRNAGNTMVETTVRQEVPTGATTTGVTGGGQTTGTIGSAGAREVTWRLRLPAQSTTTLNTAFSGTPGGGSVTAPTCVYGSDGTRPYDCTTATWTGPAAAVPAAQVTAAPAWRRPPVLLAALAALLVVTGGALWWGWQRRRRRSGVRPGGPAPADAGIPPVVGGATGPAARGTLHPRPATPRVGARRRTPPIWLVVGVAAAVLAGVVGAAAWTATQRVAAIDTAKQPTSGAWLGSSVTGPVGMPLRESAFEFTVYRMACGVGELPSARQGRQCLATIGVRNLTPDEQTWHGQLQRAYLPGGSWVAADEDATRVANLGRDVFAQPVAAGSRVLLPLVFTLQGNQPPKQLELRSGVFSAGVRVDVA